MIKKRKIRLLLYLVVMIFLSIMTYFFTSFHEVEIIENISENISRDIIISFCPQEGCYLIFANEIINAENSLSCAFYELDNINLSRLIYEKSIEGVEVKLVIDNEYLDEESLDIFKNSNVKIKSDVNRKTRYNNYMHHKFCVIDDRILITGSMNPTDNGFYKNDNNLVVIESEKLAKNYINEFEQIYKGTFGENKVSALEYENINLSFNNESYVVSSYFCPQDNCAEKIVEVLEGAQNEILFASFVLTHDDIEKVLLEKANSSLNVSGVIERRMINSQGSIITEMNETFPIYIDKNTATMHHKFFVIDEKIVITGSMNPSKSGDERNDENILIIVNENIAKIYKQEFYKLI